MVSRVEKNLNRRQNLGDDLIVSEKIEHLRLAAFNSPSLDDQASFRSDGSYETLRSGNLFVSPNHSSTSLQSGNTSGQDEFHLERYSSDVKTHRRQNTAGSDISKRSKPDLNIITNFAVPKMPMKTTNVVLNQVTSKQVERDRARSVISQKAVQDVSTPTGHKKQKTAYLTLADLAAGIKQKRSRTTPRAENRVSPEVQHTPIGIAVPESEVEFVKRDMEADSALPNLTPGTPAIVITPADPAGPNMAYVEHSAPWTHRPASSIYSAAPPYPQKQSGIDGRTPPLPQIFTNKPEKSQRGRYSRAKANDHFVNQRGDVGQTTATHTRRLSHESTESMLPSALTESGRPKSQGWWNLVLSPLLRAGSVISGKDKQDEATPPIPPMPFTRDDDPSPTVSFIEGPSPETPRRQGLADSRTSTWSRWTEWEEERAMNEANRKGLENNDQAHKDINFSPLDANSPAGISAPARVGLAAEYFHACAVELLTGKPYFECEGHSCAEKWPKFKSIHDNEETKVGPLGSPFEETRELPNGRKDGQPVPMRSMSFASNHSFDKDALSPNELSPNVREANTAAIVKAKALDFGKTSGADNKESTKSLESSQSVETTPLPTYTAPRRTAEMPNIATIAKPDQTKVAAPAVESPGPFSPQGQKTLAPVGAMAMEDVQPPPTNHAAPVLVNNHVGYSHLPERAAFVTHQTSYPDLPTRAPTAAVTIDDLKKDSTIRDDIESRRQRLEKEDQMARKAGGLWRGRGCFPKNGCFGRPGREGRTKRRWIVAIAVFLLAVIIASIVLAITLTKHGDATPVDSQWLNLTGFPPMPTGISTIAVPNLADSQNQCAAPTTMWSCSVSKEDRIQIGSNDPDQPNFRFEIAFRNGTVASNLTIPISDAPSTNKSLAHRANDPFTNDLFVPSPSAPNEPDQIFLGSTTDNITAPFNGEETPFFITFMSTFPIIPSAYADKASSSSTKGSSLFPRQSSNSSLLSTIPPAATFPNGTSLPTNLLPTNPFFVSQPIRLYNRGLEDEHYGFYNYFDKTIFLSAFQISNESTTMPGSETAADADQDGGCTESQAKSVCTWSQTRFLVKMYTNPSFSGQLLAPPPVDPSAEGTNNGQNSATESSATNFNRPGSFPYPTSISLDRHGGDIKEKGIYCYSINGDGVVEENEKVFVGELRSFGGQLINPAPTLAGDLGNFNQSAGGIDGGTGGCGCTWQNFQ